MKGCMSTELGIITIAPEVIAKYAGTVAVECFGIVGMDFLFYAYLTFILYSVLPVFTTTYKTFLQIVK